MADIRIRQGDSATITETITGLTSIDGYTAKMYIYNASGAVATLTGVISTLTVTYTILNEVSKLWTVGLYSFETKLWDGSDHVYTPCAGVLAVDKTIEEDPS